MTMKLVPGGGIEHSEGYTPNNDNHHSIDPKRISGEDEINDLSTKKSRKIKSG